MKGAMSLPASTLEQVTSGQRSSAAVVAGRPPFCAHSALAHFFSPAPNSVPHVVHAGSCWQKMDRQAEQTNLQEDGEQVRSTCILLPPRGHCAVPRRTLSPRPKSINPVNQSSQSIRSLNPVNQFGLTPGRWAACGRSRRHGSPHERCPAGAGSVGSGRRPQRRTATGGGTSERRLSAGEGQRETVVGPGVGSKWWTARRNCKLQHPQCPAGSESNSRGRGEHRLKAEGEAKSGAPALLPAR